MQRLCLSNPFDGFSPPAEEIVLGKLAIQEDVFRSVPGWFLSALQPKYSFDSWLSARHYEHKLYGGREEQHLHLGFGYTVCGGTQGE